MAGNDEKKKKKPSYLDIIVNKDQGETKPQPSALGTGLAKEAADTALERQKKMKEATGEMPGYKKGGTVKKTGKAVLHKGEKKVTTSGKSSMVKKTGPAPVRKGDKIIPKAKVASTPVRRSTGKRR